MILRRVIIAPDSFKGSLSAREVTDILSKEVIRAYPDCEIIPLPIADGGEGSLPTILSAMGGVTYCENVIGPAGNSITAKYGIASEGTAVLEMAQSSGLTCQSTLHPMTSSSYGFGQLICSALDKKADRFILCIGGSATTDGGCGMASALGAQFLDEAGNSFVPAGGTLCNIAQIDLSKLDPRIAKCHFSVMCDVKNPLFGKNGAAYVYGPQKGAAPEQIALLDEGLRHLNRCIMALGLPDYSQVPGGGAAGGMGVGCLAFLNAELKSGSSAILDLFRFEEQAQHVDLVITGEGRLDEQSLSGKVLSGILKQSGSTPVISICGKCQFDPSHIRKDKLAVFECGRGVSVDESMSHANQYISEAARKAMAFVSASDNLFKK